MCRSVPQSGRRSLVVCPGPTCPPPRTTRMSGAPRALPDAFGRSDRHRHRRRPSNTTAYANKSLHELCRNCVRPTRKPRTTGTKHGVTPTSTGWPQPVDSAARCDAWMSLGEGRRTALSKRAPSRFAHGRRQSRRGMRGGGYFRLNASGPQRLGGRYGCELHSLDLGRMQRVTDSATRPVPRYYHGRPGNVPSAYFGNKLSPSSRCSAPG